MTIERLAVCLSVSSRRLIEFVMGGEELPEELKETHRLLSLAFDEIAVTYRARDGKGQQSLDGYFSVKEQPELQG